MGMGSSMLPPHINVNLIQKRKIDLFLACKQLDRLPSELMDEDEVTLNEYIQFKIGVQEGIKK